MDALERLKAVLVFLGDLISFNLGFVVAFAIRDLLQGLFPKELHSFALFTGFLLSANIIFLVIFLLSGLYKEKRNIFDLEEFSRLSYALFFTFLISILLTFLLRTTASFSRFVIILGFVLAFSLICSSRRIIRMLFAVAAWKKRRAIIVGKGDTGIELANKLKAKPQLGYRLIGFVDDRKKCLGKVAQLASIIGKHRIQTVFIALPQKSYERVLEIVAHHHNVEFKIVPGLLELITDQLNFGEFKDYPLIDIRQQSRSYLVLKRFIDIIVSLMCIIILAPLLALVAILIVTTSEGPVCYKQMRIGKDGKRFLLYKFRTMYRDAHRYLKQQKRAALSPYIKIRNDPRVTSLGVVLRRTCIDELPQLFHVLRGDMSLVGPRPLAPYDYAKLNEAEKSRQQVRPGMTGMWQISGRYDINLKRSLWLDLYYVKHVSFWLDLKILLKTVPAIIFSEGRW